MRIQRVDTQRNLADRLGIHEQHVNRVEHGHYEPTMADLVCLARVFDTTPIEIYRIMDETLTRTNEQ